MASLPLPPSPDPHLLFPLQFFSFRNWAFCPVISHSLCHLTFFSILSISQKNVLLNLVHVYSVQLGSFFEILFLCVLPPGGT